MSSSDDGVQSGLSETRENGRQGMVAEATTPPAPAEPQEAKGSRFWATLGVVAGFVKTAGVSLIEAAKVRPLTLETITDSQRAVLKKALRAGYLSKAVYQRGEPAAQSLAETLGGSLLHYSLQEHTSKLTTNVLITTATRDPHSQDFVNIVSEKAVSTISEEQGTGETSTTTTTSSFEIDVASPGTVKSSAKNARAAGDRTLYVVFRGSSSARDWVVNFTAHPTAHPRLKEVGVHSGVFHTLDVCYPLLRSKIIEFLSANPDFDLVLTGHSLGGAYATLLYLNLQLEKSQHPALEKVNMNLFTFGAPAILQSGLDEAAFREHLSTKVDTQSMHMFVHGHDIVPRLLGTSLTDDLGVMLGLPAELKQMQEFKHVGNYYLLRYDDLCACSRPSQAVTAPHPLLTAFSMAVAQRPNLVVSDHSMRLYLSKLRNAHEKLTSLARAASITC